MNNKSNTPGNRKTKSNSPPSKSISLPFREDYANPAKQHPGDRTIATKQRPPPSNTGYNGWTNRSTWNVSLWLNNEEPLYQEFMDILKHYGNDREAATAIENYCRFIWGDKTPDGDSLDLANFEEIARENRE